MEHFIQNIAGVEKGGGIPNLKAEYKGGNIEAEGSVVSGKIERIEERYKGEVIVVKINPEGKQILKAEKAGWYEIRAVTGEGKVRYAWVRTNAISDKLTMPEITITPSNADGDNKWYKTIPKVTITANSALGENLVYTVAGAMQEEGGEKEKRVGFEGGKASFTLDVTKIGYTRITARVEGDGGKESKEITEFIKYDNTKPYITVDKLEPKGTYGENGWMTTEAEVKIEAEDTGSGVKGYTYEVVKVEGGTQTKIKESANMIEKEVPIKIETDGEYVIKVTICDNAGNKLEGQTINIKKDRNSPNSRETSNI